MFICCIVYGNMCIITVLQTYPLVAEDPEGALEPFLVVPGDRDARKTQVLADLSKDPRQRSAT